MAGHDGGQLDGLGMDGVGGGGRRSTGEGIVRADYKWRGKHTRTRHEQVQLKGTQEPPHQPERATQTMWRGEEDTSGGTAQPRD